MENHSGKKAEIQNIVVDFSITESLYASGLIFRANIKDTINFLEEYQIIGQETITIKLSRQAFFSKEEDSVTLEFTVTDYPAYAKGSQQNTQAYSLVALSPHIFSSKLQKISRAITLENSKEIEKIVTIDCSADRIGKIEKTNTVLKGCFPYSNPLDLVSWITQNSYDGYGSPFFFYETLYTGINFRSYSSLLTDEEFRTFTSSQVYVSKPNTKEDYEEKQRRILSISSDFRVSKLVPAIGGAYSSTSSFVDIAKKKINVENFAYSDLKLNNTSTEKNPILSESFKVPFGNLGFTKPISKFTTAHNVFFSENSIQNLYGNNMKNQNYSRSKAIHENMDNFVHTVTVAGDFRLNAGTIIRLNIPKSIDMGAIDKDSLSKDISLNSILSGRYIVTAVIHNFGTEYRCDLTVKKDSLSFKL